MTGWCFEAPRPKIKNASTAERSVKVMCQVLWQDTGKVTLELLTATLQHHSEAFQQQASILEQLNINLDSLARECGKLDQRLQVIERQQDTNQNKEAASKESAAFLSLLQDYVAVFCTKMISQLSYKIDSWPELAILLAEEASAAKESGSQPGLVTKDLINTLAQHHFTWND